MGSLKQETQRYRTGTELVLNQAQNVLKLIDLENRGEVVEVDGIGLKKPSRDAGHKLSAGKHGIHYEPIFGYGRDEPRIKLIKTWLENALQLIEFRKDNQTVQVDGFRLKDLQQWANHRALSLSGNIGSISGACNCRCEICYIVGSKVPWGRGMLTTEEVKTRIKYYSSEARKGLPVKLQEEYETFCNPQALEILRLVRERMPDELIKITTNGTHLTEDVIRQISELKPVDVHLSLNSANPSIRRKVMGDPNPEVAIESVKLLRKYGIRFAGSIVPWPSITPDDIADTVRYLDEYSAVLVTILLPGYTKYHLEKRGFDVDECNKRWSEVPELARELRLSIETPILVQPTAYWMKDLITPTIDGVIRNSPAARAGLKSGDQIIEVNGTPVYTKSQAQYLLLDIGEDSKKTIKVERAEEILQAELDGKINISDDLYPYKPPGYGTSSLRYSYGVVMVDAFKINYIRKLKEIIEKHEAHKVLLFSSRLMRPVFIQAITVAGDYASFINNVDLRATIAEHNFWGGNIMLCDLHVVQDFIDHLHELVREYDYRPDLIVIPSSFGNEYGIDLIGDSFLRIERIFGIPVELLPCEPIMT